MKLIVGLGNPGAEYKNTYHNCGFLSVDALAEKLGVSLKKSECHALTAHIFVNGNKVILAKPQTFMNLSGKSVWALAAKYKLERKDLIVVYDDVDLPLGTLRFREEGRPGTHNGMKDIVERIGSSEFKRLRVGIGEPPERMQLSDFVTGRISELNAVFLKDAFAKAAEGLMRYCEGEDFAALMQRYN